MLPLLVNHIMVSHVVSLICMGRKVNGIGVRNQARIRFSHITCFHLGQSLLHLRLNFNWFNSLNCIYV